MEYIIQRRISDRLYKLNFYYQLLIQESSKLILLFKPFITKYIENSSGISFIKIVYQSTNLFESGLHTIS